MTWRNSEMAEFPAPLLLHMSMLPDAAEDISISTLSNNQKILNWIPGAGNNYIPLLSSCLDPKARGP